MKHHTYFYVGKPSVIVTVIGEGFIRMGTKHKQPAIIYQDEAGEIGARTKAEFTRNFKEVPK